MYTNIIIVVFLKTIRNIGSLPGYKYAPEVQYFLAKMTLQNYNLFTTYITQTAGLQINESISIDWFSIHWNSQDSVLLNVRVLEIVTKRK